jgi:hypothetical protein
VQCSAVQCSLSAHLPQEPAPLALPGLARGRRVTVTTTRRRRHRRPCRRGLDGGRDAERPLAATNWSHRLRRRRRRRCRGGGGGGAALPWGRAGVGNAETHSLWRRGGGFNDGPLLLLLLLRTPPRRDRLGRHRRRRPLLPPRWRCSSRHDDILPARLHCQHLHRRQAAARAARIMNSPHRGRWRPPAAALGGGGGGGGARSACAAAGVLAGARVPAGSDLGRRVRGGVGDLRDAPEQQCMGCY